MKIKILPIIATAILMFFFACGNDELISETDPDVDQNTNRTISLSVSIPGDIPSTRLGVEQKEDMSIALTWEAADQLELAFVQGKNKKKKTVTPIGISTDGKRAQFDITLPTGIKGGKFDLYGVYGGNGLSETNPTDVILTSNAGDVRSLEEVKTSGDIMFYFELKDVDVSNPKLSTTFQHLGSLFSITLFNAGSESIDNLAEARLVGISGDSNWAYNYNEGGMIYDLVNGEFQEKLAGGNYLSFKAEKSSLPSGDAITFWGWYPPLPDKNWPELKLELRDATSILATSIDSKPILAVAGKSYYFYAEINGSQLSLTDEYHSVHVETMGTLATLLNADQKGAIRKLIVTGELNKADFDVMKLQMLNLVYIDLTNATCENDKIPDEAFGEYQGSHQPNKTINTIILPTSIKTIGFKAFAQCTGLTGTLTIPDGVTTIEGWAFYLCDGFSGPLILPDGLTEIGERAFQANKKSVYSGDLIIPDGITTIEQYAFGGQRGFKSTLTLPASLESIYNFAFMDCSFTGTLIIPNNAKYIGQRAFQNTKFTGLVVGNSVETIDNNAFLNCSTMAGSITFPSTLTTLGASALGSCVDVNPFRFKSAEPIEYKSDMLPNEARVEVPIGAVGAYKSKEGWDVFNNIIGY